MTTIDIPFISERIRTAGTNLREEAARGLRFAAREDIFDKLMMMNDQIADSIREPLGQRYPQIRWSDSEFDLRDQQQAEYDEYWICDPLDGALHFAHGFSFYALSLCLVRDREPVAPFVYDPVAQELFHAVTGEGAYLNGKPIRTSSKTELTDAFVTTSLPSRPAEDADAAQQTVRGIASVMNKALAVKMLGSVSLQLAYVASGRLDGYFEFGNDYYDWLAGSLLIREAGGIVADGTGGPFTWGTTGIVAGSKGTFEPLLSALSTAQD